MLVAGITLFGLNLGDHPSALIPVILSLSFFCGAIGLLFGVVFNSEQQVTAPAPFFGGGVSFSVPSSLARRCVP